jgi:hypothetical protein
MSEKITQHTRQVRQDIVVPIPNDRHAFVREPTGAAVISLLPLFGMLSAVDFNCEAEARAVKINRERSDRVLSSEMKTIELIAAQRVP